MSKKPTPLPKRPDITAQAAAYVCGALATVPGSEYRWAMRAMFEWRDAASSGFDRKNERSISERAHGKAWQDVWQAAAIGWASR